MSKSAASQANNLTGIWYGLYTYPNGSSVSFVATLIDSGTLLSGTTHEAGAAEDAPGGTLFATLCGRRNAGVVTFVKTYDRARRRYRNPVAYEGSLSADSTEIEGRWTIQRNWSGKFLMIRSVGRAETVEQKVAEKAK